jgi:hypothetical protein
VLEAKNPVLLLIAPLFVDRIKTYLPGWLTNDLKQRGQKNGPCAYLAWSFIVGLNNKDMQLAQ